MTEHIIGPMARLAGWVRRLKPRRPIPTVVRCDACNAIWHRPAVDARMSLCVFVGEHVKCPRYSGPDDPALKANGAVPRHRTGTYP